MAENKQARQIIEKFGFATMISFPENEMPFVNHLPLILSPRPQEEEIILGHMALRNPQWQHFEKNAQCMLVFNGPHAYITPTWYQSGRDVPTWNYAVVHLLGKIELIKSFAGQIETLKYLTAFYEKSNLQPWKFELPADLLDEASLCSAIISFKFHIQKIETKFKFSQNRSDADRHGIIEGLASRTDDSSQGVRDIMLELEKGRA